MTEAERELSEARRKQIFEQNRASNRHRPNRVIQPGDRAAELLARIGVTVVPDDAPVNWSVLTRSA